MFLSLMALMFTGYPIGWCWAGSPSLTGPWASRSIFSFAEILYFVPQVWLFAKSSTHRRAAADHPHGGDVGALIGKMLKPHLLLRAIPGGRRFRWRSWGSFRRHHRCGWGLGHHAHLIALPTMLKAGYRHPAGAGHDRRVVDLGILIAGILLVFLCEMMQISWLPVRRGDLSGPYPGAVLCAVYRRRGDSHPRAAPRWREPPLSVAVLWRAFAVGVLPTAILIFLVMGSVLMGFSPLPNPPRLARRRCWPGFAP